MHRTTTRFTVCFLFDAQGHVLLVRKNHTAFAGKLNGVGGRLEPNETPYDNAARKIQEETGAMPSELTWIGDLNLPESCDINNPHAPCCLHFYAGITDKDHVAKQPGKEPLEWHSVSDIIHNPEYDGLAGDGDVWYFIKRAAKMV